MKKMLFFWILFSILRLYAGKMEENNQIIVCDNGSEMFQWDLDFVRHAEQSIEISAVFLGGTIARELLTELEKRLIQVPDLQIYLLTNPILLEQSDLDMLNNLQRKYPHHFHLQYATTIAVVWPDVTGIDNHIKMFVVDEKYFSAGGTNLDEAQCSEGTWTPSRNYNKIHPTTSDYLPAGMRDQDVVGRGPLAKQLRESFYKLYALWEHYNQTGVLQKDPEYFQDKTHYFPITCKGSVQRFEMAPRQRLLKSEQIKKIIGGAHQEKNAITAHYVKLINEAQSEIIIANLYFSPVEPILQALMKAVNRGIKLTVLTNGISDIAPKYTTLFSWANRMTYVPVLYGSKYRFWEAQYVENQSIKNTRIFEYHVRDILLHKKMMIVDRKKSIIGSYNLGTRSDIGEYEMIIEFDSAEIANDLIGVHQKDLQFSREVTPKEARDWYFDPIKSYLGEIQKRFHGLI